MLLVLDYQECISDMLDLSLAYPTQKSYYPLLDHCRFLGLIYDLHASDDSVLHVFQRLLAP